MLGDLIIPVDSLSISLGMGLSIALKAGVKLPGWLWGVVSQWSGHLQLKQEALGSIPSGCPGFFTPRACARGKAISFVYCLLWTLKSLDRHI